ncbi:MAG TPA: c-type cytochrome domain-containing protein, partial [Chthoniobacteraceae bacterium]|nr:c-type cytochrome domain-containing protein [Chthoniobacteraceae bacterium]
MRLIFILCVALSLQAASAAEPLRYNRDIRPILSDNCFACHGPDKAKQKAGLRLDIRDEAMKPAESGEIAIVPGKVEESALVERILSTDKDEIMPPPKSHKVLTAAQKELIKRWVAEGAKYEPHWA